MPGISSAMLKRLLRWFLAAAAVTFLLLVSLPLLMERIVLPPLLAGRGITGLQLQVSRFGLNGCTIHVAGRPDAPPPAASGNFRIEWTLSGLLRGRLDSITFDSLLLNTGLLSGGKDAGGQAPDISTAQAERGGFPLVIDRLSIVNSFIIFRRDHGALTVPVALSARRQEEQPFDRETLRYRATLRVGMQELDADFTYDHRQGNLTGQFAGEMNFPTLAGMLAPLFPLPGQTEGRAEIILDYAVRPVPFTLVRIEGAVRLHEFRWNQPETGLAVFSRENGRLTVAGGGREYGVNIAGLVFSAPVAADVDAEANVFFDGNGAGWQGRLVVSPAVGLGKGPAGELFIDEAAPIRLRHRGRIGDGVIKASLLSESDAGEEGGYDLRYGELRIRTAGLEATGDFEFKEADGGEGLKAEAALHGRGIEVEWPDGGFTVPGAAVEVTVSSSSGSEAERMGMEGGLEVTADGLAFHAPALRFGGIRLRLPFILSGGPAQEAGDFRIDDIFFRQERVGGLAATVKQQRRELVMAGELRTVILPETPIVLTAVAGLPENGEPSGRLSWSADKGRLDVARLADFHEGLKNLSGSGTLDLAGNLTITRCGLSGDVIIGLHDGNFDLPDAQIALRDTAFSLHLPDLPHFASAPAQNLSFGTVQGKKVVMQEVMIAFQLESPESLFLEAISARWSGGRVFTGGLRLRPDMQEVEAALICDRLELAGILSQLGLAEAEGEGRMSGRIPLQYADNTIFVDDGFLFTTPGEKGNLRIRRSEQLTMGLPADGARFSPLHFAGAALGNFEYNWAKMYIGSEEENLLLQLQVDGKPRERLPYRYDPEHNVFVRLKEGEKGGIDQPIRLDVNFRVPVNELFRYYSHVIPFLLRFK